MSWKDRAKPVVEGGGSWKDRATPVVEQAEPESRMARAALEGFGQGASLGYADELKAALEQVTFPVASALTGMDVEADPYIEARDKYARESKKLADENPGSYGVGNVGGAIATGIASAPLTGVKALTGLGRAAQAVGIGAGMGALQDVDNKEGEYSLGLEDRAKNAAIGGVTGGLFQGVADLASKAPAALKSIANSRAVKATGIGKKDMVALQKQGKVDELGNYLLENNAVGFGDSIDDIALKTGKLQESAGTKLNDVYQRAATLFKEKASSGGFDPLRDKAEIMAAARKELGESVGSDSALGKLSSYLDEVAKRHGDAPFEQAMSGYDKNLSKYNKDNEAFLNQLAKYKEELGAAADTEQPVLPNMFDDLQRTDKSKLTVETLGKDASKMTPEAFEYGTQMGLTPLPPKPGPVFNKMRGDDLFPMQEQMALDEIGSNRFLQQSKQAGIDGTELTPRSYAQGDVPGIKSGSGQLEFSVMPEQPILPTKPADIRNPMMPKSANEVKSALDREINYARNPLLKDPATEKAFYGARSKIAEKLEGQIEDLGGTSLGDELRGANKSYGFAKSAKGFADDKAAREAVNRDVSLTDYLTGASGASIGGLPGAIAGAVLNKVGRNYGNAATAATLDKVSKALMKSPQWATLAKDNPQAFSNLVTNMASRLGENGTEKNMSVAEARPFKNKEEILQKSSNSKYAQVMQKAAEKGNDSLAAANYVLSQRDPEYRKMMESEGQ